MQDVVKSVTYIDFNGDIKTLQNKELQFDYRQSIFSKHKLGIIIEAILELKKGNLTQIEDKMIKYANYRKEKQPISYPNAGSTFKRGDNYITAQLIDECGLKDYQIGGAKISDLHAGFIINTGDATAKDVLDLIAYTKQMVYQKFKKEIQLEIEILGEN